jgi:hypothetical protein
MTDTEAIYHINHLIEGLDVEIKISAGREYSRTEKTARLQKEALLLALSWQKKSGKSAAPHS